MAEKLDYSKEAQEEAARLLSNFANPNRGLRPAAPVPKVENLERKEINDDFRKELLESISMKPRVQNNGDPNVLHNQDQKKIADLAKNIFAGDGLRVKK